MFGLDNNVLLGLVGVVVVFCLLTNKKSFKSLMKKDMLVIVGLTLLLACCLSKGGKVVEGLKGGVDNPMNIATLFNSLEFLNPELHFTEQCTKEVRDGLMNAGVAIKSEMCGDQEEVNSLLNAMIEANLFAEAATHLKTNIANRCN